MSNSWIDDVWNPNDYQTKKKNNFKIIDEYLEKAPLNILDIGCGLAWESRLFQQKYNSKLWLLDGDRNFTEEDNKTEVGWNPTVDTLRFYHKLDFLDKTLKDLGTQNYKLLDTNNLEIPKDVKFDLIVSFQSCGFHYPANTYKSLILNHCDQNTKIIFDVRFQKRQLRITDDVEIIKILSEHEKHKLVEIKFK